MAVGVYLRADAVVFVIGERADTERRDDFFGIFLRLCEHERERVKQRHFGAFESIASGEQRGRADIAGEHVRPANGIDSSFECLGDRRLDETFLQPDAKLADQNLHDVSRAFCVDFA